MSANDQNSRDTPSLFRELPYFGLNVNLAYGQFNNYVYLRICRPKNT